MPPERNAPPLRALIYNRVSADPSGSRVSVNSQDHENRALCERNGWEIAGTITDNDRSATRYAGRVREGYEQVLNAITGQSPLGRIDILVTWEASRAERNMDTYPRLRQLLATHHVLHAYNGKLHDLNEGGDRFAATLDVLLAEREAEIARERTLRSHRDSARRGTPRGVTPYGYMREYDPHSGRMVSQVPDPETAPVIRELVSRVLAGETLYAVAQDFNRRGVLTPRGRRDQLSGETAPRPGWSSSMIRNLLGKQSLMGVRTHNGVAVGEATWPPLISPEDWAKVQAVLADPLRSRNDRGVQVRFLLSGIAECGVCGAWMRPLRNQGRPTYVCAGKVPTDGKGHVARSQPGLDAFVIRAVVERSAGTDFMQVLAQRHSSSATEVAAAERELADLRAKLAEYEKAATQKTGLALESLLRILDQLQAQYEDAERRAAPRGVHPAVLDLAGPDAPDRWDRMPLERRRQVIRALVRVRVHRSNAPKGSHAFDDSSIELDWI